MIQKLVTIFLTTIIALSLWQPGATVQAQNDKGTPVFILLAPEHSQMLKLRQIQATIQMHGGHVTHIFPYQAMIASVPFQAAAQLAALPEAALVSTQIVDPALIDIYGADARRYAQVWNDLIQPQPASEIGALDSGHSGDLEDKEHAFVAPDLPSGDGLAVAANTTATPGYYQTSEYMAGAVAVGIVLVESDGSIDPSSENWTNDEKQLVFSEIVAALNWWVGLEPRAKLSFVYDDHFSNPLPTTVEPIKRSYLDQQYWISDAMGALGYTSSSYFSSVRNYNNALRAAYQTDWAFTIFVVDSSSDSDNRFSDGYFAYAYLGGPFMVMTSGNNGYGPYNMDAVAAHEIGHIFHALDQYSSAYQACDRRSGYLSIENQNSQYGSCGSNVTSIMRGQVYPYSAKAIDSYAAGQIGWRDSDNDNILDPLDTALPVNLNAVVQEGNTVSVSGMAEIIPYPSPSYTSVTINRLTGVQYRLNGSSWQPALPDDGWFDATIEGFHFTIDSIPPGLYTLEVAGTDSAGNISDLYAAATVKLLDPVDGGLFTELYPLAGQVSINQETVIINGRAYHLASGTITNVQYRVNGGAWQSASPQDGSFDSDYEPFTVNLFSAEPGTYIIEAFAIDSEGNVEASIASQQIEIETAQAQTIFLPLVRSGT